MRFIPATLILVLAAVPALAQTAGSLPPPVPRPAEPTAPATHGAATHQPGLGERAGAAIDRAAESTGQALERATEETGSALGRAMRWSGQRMQGAGEWTQRQGERIIGPSAAPPEHAQPAR